MSVQSSDWVISQSQLVSDSTTRGQMWPSTVVEGQVFLFNEGIRTLTLVHLVLLMVMSNSMKLKAAV